jgi:hypothetical protein
MPFYWTLYRHEDTGAYEHIQGPTDPEVGPRLSWEADTPEDAIGQAAIAKQRSGVFVAFQMDGADVPTVTSTEVKPFADHAVLSVDGV